LFRKGFSKSGPPLKICLKGPRPRVGDFPIKICLALTQLSLKGPA